MKSPINPLYFGGIKMTRVYERIASLSMAIDECIKRKNDEWLQKHNDALDELMDTCPHGSGIDGETHLVSASETRIRISTEYHHMNEGGMYDGWTEHDIIVKPSLAFGINVKVTGRNRNDINEYLAEVFLSWLQGDTP